MEKSCPQTGAGVGAIWSLRFLPIHAILGFMILKTRDLFDKEKRWRHL